MVMRGGKKLTRNQKIKKAVLITKLKTNLKVFPLHPWRQKISLVFGSILARNTSGEGPQLHRACRFTERQMLHTPQLRLCVVTSDQRSYSMQCICFGYRNIEKIFIKI